MPALATEEEAAIRADQRAAKVPVVQEHRADVLVADEMPVESARKVREPANPAEALAVERADHEDFYGDVTPETLAFDAEGKGVKKIRNYARLKVLRDGLGVKLLEGDAKAVQDGVTAAHLRYTYLEAVGLMLRRDVEENPVQFLASVLRRLGLSLGNKARKVGGKVRRACWLDGDSVATMEKFSTRNERRLRLGVEEEGDFVPTEALVTGCLSEGAAEELLAELGAA